MDLVNHTTADSTVEGHVAAEAAAAKTEAAPIN